MHKALHVAALVAALAAGVVQADTLARIKETGAVTMGVRESSGALSYHGDSFLLLQTGRADAFVMDSQILASHIGQAADPADYRIVGEVLSVEPIAIMLRKDDPAFKRAVDDSIVSMMKSGEVARLYERWFMQPIPPSGKRVGLPPSEATLAAWAEPNDRPVEADRNK